MKTTWRTWYYRLIVGAMVVAFLVLTIWQRMGGNTQVIVAKPTPQPVTTKQEVGLQETKNEAVMTTSSLRDLPFLRSVNPSFYGEAEEGDILRTYPDRLEIFRLRTNAVIATMPR